jgi:unsaturated rhamnogalacturonyl hydrolase
MKSWWKLLIGLGLALSACGGGADEAPDSVAEALETQEESAAVRPFDWCSPEVPPDSACFASKRDPASAEVALALDLARRFMAVHPPEGLAWGWEPAVLLIALTDLYAVTGEAEVQAYYRAWLDHHLAKGYSIKTSDTCVPAAVAVALYAQTGEAAYRAVAEDALKYLNEEAKRTPDGGISHLGTLPIETLWVDSLFMFGSVLTRWGEAQGDVAALDLLGQQFAIFGQRLQGEGGFFSHAVDWSLPQTPGTYWGRGNGWVLASAYQYLRTRALRGEADPAVEALAGKLRAAALAARDAPSGLWWTLLNRPGEGYLETSAAALFAYGTARAWRLGLAGDEVLPALAGALRGLRSQVRLDLQDRPVLMGTSGPTTAGAAQDYLEVPQEDDLAYGVGAAILALTELSGLPLPGPAYDGALDRATPGYRARQAEYLEACRQANGPGQGGVYGIACRVATGEPTFNTTALDASLAKIAARQDTSDFHVAALVRILALDRRTGALPQAERERIEDTVLAFKYWLDEPGDDKMCYWTENHQILYHSNELLAGQLFPDRVFSNNGQRGAWHRAHAEPLVRRWLDLRGRLGFSEWHSNVYFNEDLPAVANLAHFAQAPDIRAKAAMVLDLMALDLLNNTYKGLFATVKGRTYEGHFLPGLSDSTREAAWIMLGLGEYRSLDNFSAVFLATGEGSWTAPPLESLAAAVAARHEHRQRDGLDVVDGAQVGIGYESDQDIVFWAGMAALVAPEVIEGMAAFLDRHGLWDGFLFGDIPDNYLNLLLSVKDTPGELKKLASKLELASRGIGLESMGTYTWRTPDYQLSGAQDYKAGYWSSQTQVWLATLDDQCYVATNYAGETPEAGGGLDFAGAWTGNWLPRATFHRNVGVIQYRKSDLPILGDIFKGNNSHAFFPRGRFDQVREEGGWVMGRKGTGYVALHSISPAHWAEDNDYAWEAEGPDNVWVVELGSAEEDGSFEAFGDGIAAATVSLEAGVVTYQSPSQGLVQVGWEGPMTVAGQPVDLGPFPRFANDRFTQEWGTDRTRLTHDGLELDLDFQRGWRQVTSATTR